MLYEDAHAPRSPGEEDLRLENLGLGVLSRWERPLEGLLLGNSLVCSLRKPDPSQI